MLNIENNIKPYLMNILKHTSVLLIAILFLNGTLFGQESQRQRLERHVYTLAADSLNGRKAGSPDAARARAYISRQWSEMGLNPFWKNDSLAQTLDYEMPFDLYDEGKYKYCNLVAFIEGNDPVLKDEYIVIGGHYDHLGVKDGNVYNGADDNASGTACVTEVARQLLARQSELKRSVVICAFDAEEIGLYGSQSLVVSMRKEGLLDKVKLMMSIDMVGWLKAGKALTMEGSGTLADPNLLLEARTPDVNIPIRKKKFENSIFTATDTGPFATQGIATLAVTTGLKSPYHKPGDDPELIDYEGLDYITDYLAAFVLRASQQPGNLASGKVAHKHRQVQRKFMVGPVIGANRGYINLVDAAATPKDLIGWTGGLQMQYNFSDSWALHSKVLYSYSRNRMPFADDAYGEGYRLRQESVMVPLTLQLGVYSPTFSAYLRAGGYFNYLLHMGSYYTGDNEPISIPTFQAPSPYRGGFTWGWGIRIGHMSFDMDSYYQYGDLFNTSVNLPKAHGSGLAVTLGYYF